MKYIQNSTRIDKSLFISILLICFAILPTIAQVAIVPSKQELDRAFGKHDKELFKKPPKVYYPQTWFHYIGGNVAKEGITADLEAIASAGISGIQLFHGQFGGPWPGVEPQIACLSPMWEDALRHTAEECQRLGLRFTMLNCPGWAMAGGPWIEPSNAMRTLAWSRTDITDGEVYTASTLAIPQPSNEPWRDYKEVAILAFPTPLGDTGIALSPLSIKSSKDVAWEKFLKEEEKSPLRFEPSTTDNPHWLELTFAEATPIRTLQLPSVNSLNHEWCYDPGVTITMQAILDNGDIEEVLNTPLPQSNWQDESPLSLACTEIKAARKYKITIVNKHGMTLGSLRLFTAARKNSWESEAGWTLRSILRNGDKALQSAASCVDATQIQDITALMDNEGILKWNAPKGNWTILRIGHVNAGLQNGPAPPEGTGWECDKLSEEGANAQFAGYIGKLSANDAPLGKGLLNGMLFDSWECKTQTWTNNMEAEFERVSNYSLRQWLPALLGYVVGNSESTSLFLNDWRATINDLFTDKFYGRMQTLAKENNLAITFETAAGDVFPADILEYFKYADVPMCEFWQPLTDGFVGSFNFKPIKPTASAARLYGKPRVAAEAFTSFALTWDEHFSMLKEAANINSSEGVTHLVFHTYTHNPRTDFLPPGTSFGAGIGTPFLRGQTWWKHTPELNDYFARCSYLLERGKPVSDILWYLGDEVNHKPNQDAAFPLGFKYDYCNPDILLHRLSVDKGMLVTPEGIRYRVLWLADAPRMLPQTLEKLASLIRQGATVVGNPPEGLATLTGGKESQKRFHAAVKSIWGQVPQQGISKLGKGYIVSGMRIEEALNQLKMKPDVLGGDALWLHRKVEGADWYFVSAPKGKGFEGTLEFRAKGNVELWDPVTASITAIASHTQGDYTRVAISLPQAGACFLVFRQLNQSKAQQKPIAEKQLVSTISFPKDWTLSFPKGWGAPLSVHIPILKAWKDLDVSPEAKAFSGSAVYTTNINVEDIQAGMLFALDLGRVDMIATVWLNGKRIATRWATPYSMDITDFIQLGSNQLTVEVTSTWYNRLVYDAGQAEDKRKTWTINGPSGESPLRESGLLGPVSIRVEK